MGGRVMGWPPSGPRDWRPGLTPAGQTGEKPTQLAGRGDCPEPAVSRWASTLAGLAGRIMPMNKREFRMFCLRVRDPEAGVADLNRYLASAGVLSVTKEFVADGGNSFWTVLVEARAAEAAPEAGRGPRIDYALKLTPEQFKVFRALRDYRKKVAEAEGVPAFSILTNEQLSQIVERQVLSLAALGEVPGVGPARVERYGGAILEILRALAGTQPGETKPGPA